MKTFIFDQKKVYPISAKRQGILDGTKEPKAWKDPEKEAFAVTNISEEAYAYHSSFLDYLEKCYNTHQSVVLQPHVFWNTILNEISGYVNENSESCRHLFTDSDEKKEILVENGTIIPPLDKFEAQLRKLVPTNMDPFLPEFSTTTPQARLANVATFMETVSPFYSYSMFCCGYNAVRVDGSIEDWRRISDTARYLTEILPDLDVYLNKVALTIDNFIGWIQNGDGEEIAKILTNTRIGSGGQTQIAGWITNFFRSPPNSPRLCNFPTHIAKISYTTTWNNKKYHMCYGLFSSKLDSKGFMVPDYSWVINERLEICNE